MRRKYAFFLVFMALAMLLGMAGGAQAEDYTWTGSDGNWSDPSHWSTAGGPPPSGPPNSANDTAWLDNNPGNNVTVYLNGNYTVNQLTVDTGDALTFNDSGIALFLAGAGATIINNGTITIPGHAWSPYLYANGVTATLTGSGILELAGTGNGYLSGTGFINETSHTIQGQGTIYGSMNNKGTIKAKDGTMKFNGATVDNSGTLSAGGQLLHLFSTTVNNTGQINPDGGIVRLDAARLYNPNLGAGTTEVRTNDSYLYGAANLDAGAQINVTDGRTLHLVADAGTNLVSGGAIELQGTGWATYLYANSSVATLQSKVVMAGSGPGINYLSGTGFINDTGNLIEGRGIINAPMTNRGTIRAKDGELEFSGVTVDNSGTLSANGQLLHLYSTTVNRIGAAWINPDGGTVRLDATRLYNPNLGAGTTEVRFNNSYLYGAANLDAGARINITDQRYLYLVADGGTAPSLSGGAVQLQGSGWATYLYANGSVATLNTPVDLAGTGNNYLSGTGFINDTGNLIEGRGTINAPMTNKGTIRARDGELQFSGDTVNNSGILSAGGQLLNLFSTTVRRVGAGQINPDGGLVRLDAAALYNPNLGTGTTEVRFNNSYLYGAANLAAGAQINVTDGRTLYLTADGGTAPSLTGGKVELQGTGWATYLTANGSVATLAGGSTVDLAGNGNNYLQGTGFATEAGSSIEGKGHIQAAITNNGTIAAKNGTLYVERSITGNGKVSVAGGATLNLAGYDVHTGNFEMLGSGALIGGSVRTFNLTKNFSFTQTDESKWNSGNGFRLQMSGGGGGGGMQSLEVGGEDMGLIAAGFASNFHLEKLSLTELSTYAYLQDAYDNGNRGLDVAEALYVDSLSVAADTTLNLNLLNLYTMKPGEGIHLVTILDDGQAWLGGGHIINEAVVIPLPSTLMLLGSGLLGLAGLRRRFTEN
ncbi:MAG: PEP-CTERM sorting domain-containing protein [Desulfobaccales bacterium]